MKAYHALVAGDSGSGKTTWLRECHAEFNGASVFINHSDESNVSGARARGRTAMDNADRNLINYQTSSSDLIEACENVRRFAIDYHEKTGWSCQVVLDEAQVVLGESIPQEHPLAWMLHQGRSDGIKVVIGTQDPSDLQPNYSHIKQCRHFVWVGQPSVWHRGFLNYFSMPRDELPGQDYRYVTFDKTMNVVYRGQTNEKYG